MTKEKRFPEWTRELAFALLLVRIQQNERNLEDRNDLVKQAVAKADAYGLAAGFQADPAHAGGTIATIHLPTGQVRWLLPGLSLASGDQADPEQSRRIHAYAQAVLAKARKEKKPNERHPHR